MLRPFCYLYDEVGELLGFGGMELGFELALKGLDFLVEVMGELAFWHESRCGKVFANLCDFGSVCEFGN